MPIVGAHNLLWALLLTACACSYSFAWSPVSHPMHRASFQASITARKTRTTQPFRTTPRIAMSSTGMQAPPKRVAVLGAGAAGLVAGRLLREAGLDVHILEQASTVGGVWKYRPKDVMYKSLTTNLPKEIMAFHDAPFDPTLPSFLGHAQVQEYLETYAKMHSLAEVIEFNTEVQAVRPVRRSSSSSSSSSGSEDGKEKDGYVPWPPGDYTVFKTDERGKGEEEGEEPLWQVTTASSIHRYHHNQQQQQEQRHEIYDAVVVCNGHYDVPYSPSLPGLSENYKGRILHSREYDNPEIFRGLKVLCLGYKSSGTDIAREVAAVAKEVHVVDRRLSKGKEGGVKEGQEIGLQLGNIHRRPDLLGFFPGDDGEGKRVGFVDGSVCEGVDVVLLCTGYCYSMPFLSGGTPDGEASPSSPSSSTSSSLSSSSLPPSDARLLRIEDRAVFPIYQHLFHAYFPSLAFLGLLHSVVPFPMFELQAKWLVRSLLSSAPQEPGRIAGTSSCLPSPFSSSLPSRRARFQWLEDVKHRRQRAVAGAIVSAVPTAAAGAAAAATAAVPPAVVPEGPAGPPPPPPPAATAATAAAGLGRDWFYMGPNQWAYNRLLATQAQCLTPELEQDLKIREGIYDDVSKRRPVFPGGHDNYRKCEYRVEEGKGGWTVMDGEEKEGQAMKKEWKAQYL